MIISHTHQLIFLKPQKIAGTSFEIALSKYLSKDDIITKISSKDEKTRKSLGFRTAQNYNYPTLEFIRRLKQNKLVRVTSDKRLFIKYFNHITAKDCEELTKAKIWNGYKKVSIIRNPWNAAMSYYFWINGKTADIQNVDNFYRTHYKDFLGQNREHYFINNKLIIDQFIRFEYFKADILLLEESTPRLSGLSNTFSEITAKSGHRSRVEINWEKDAPFTHALIQCLHQFEIEKFSYLPHQKFS